MTCLEIDGQHAKPAESPGPVAYFQIQTFEKERGCCLGVSTNKKLFLVSVSELPKGTVMVIKSLDDAIND